MVGKLVTRDSILRQTHDILNSQKTQINEFNQCKISKLIKKDENNPLKPMPSEKRIGKNGKIIKYSNLLHKRVEEIKRKLRLTAQDKEIEMQKRERIYKKKEKRSK